MRKVKSSERRSGWARFLPFGFLPFPFCVLPFAFALFCAAQIHDTARGRQILDQAIQALGGPAYLNERNYRAQGRAYQFSREQLSGMARIVVYEEFPDKYRQEIEKDIVFVLNDDHGWEGTFRGVRELPREEMERIRLGRDLSVDNFLRFRLKETGLHPTALPPSGTGAAGTPGLEAAFVGTDLVDGRESEIVQVTDAQNRTVTIAFDQSSHLPVRREWERRDPKTREREINVETLGKYLAVKSGKAGGPLLAPYYIRREHNGIKIFEVFLTEVSSNVRLSESLFERPRGPDRKR